MLTERKLEIERAVAAVPSSLVELAWDYLTELRQYEFENGRGITGSRTQQRDEASYEQAHNAFMKLAKAAGQNTNLVALAVTAARRRSDDRQHYRRG